MAGLTARDEGELPLENSKLPLSHAVDFVKLEYRDVTSALLAKAEHLRTRERRMV
jgi:hypothetical protein